MKKKFKKATFAFLLICMMSMSLPVMAAENDIVVTFEDLENNYLYPYDGAYWAFKLTDDLISMDTYKKVESVTVSYFVDGQVAWSDYMPFVTFDYFWWYDQKYDFYGIGADTGYPHPLLITVDDPQFINDYNGYFRNPDNFSPEEIALFEQYFPPITAGTYVAFIPEQLIDPTGMLSYGWYPDISDGLIVSTLFSVTNDPVVNTGISAITDGFKSIFNWTGIVISSLVSGRLSGLFGLLAVFTAISVVLIGIKIYKDGTWGH